MAVKLLDLGIAGRALVEASCTHAPVGSTTVAGLMEGVVALKDLRRTKRHHWRPDSSRRSNPLQVPRALKDPALDAWHGRTRTP
jgi:hypothetical protein